MNINVVRLVCVEIIVGFIVICKDSWYSRFLNVRALILLSLAATHYQSSDIIVHFQLIVVYFYIM